ncbi:MAG: NTP transferase domain-containing protein [Oscillospiraceae bacterium]
MNSAGGRTGAVITAAGLSSRMGAFKPLLTIDGKTFAERCIEAFHDAGISDVVVVTGHMADELEKHVIPLGVTVVRNEDYALNEMLDSVKLGLAELLEKCDRTFITPVDAPVFSPDILKHQLSVLDTGSFCTVMVRHGERTGHPVLLEKLCMAYVLAYRGGGGLRGAIESFGQPIGYSDAAESTILMDADTPEDYKCMADALRHAKGESS